MKAINVERDKQGMWVHPELPVWGDNHSEAQAEAWFASQGLTHHLVLMEGELGQRWGRGDLESCVEWQPEVEVKDAFLVGIWDTEDGVVAMFASPSIEQEREPVVNTVLMSEENPTGWRLENLVSQLHDEIQAKTEHIANNNSLVDVTVHQNNLKILTHLMSIELLQRRSLATLSLIAEDNNPSDVERR